MISNQPLTFDIARDFVRRSSWNSSAGINRKRSTAPEVIPRLLRDHNDQGCGDWRWPLFARVNWQSWIVEVVMNSGFDLNRLDRMFYLKFRGWPQYADRPLKARVKGVAEWTPSFKYSGSHTLTIWSKEWQSNNGLKIQTLTYQILGQFEISVSQSSGQGCFVQADPSCKVGNDGF